MAIVAALSDLGLTAVGVREISTRPPAERWGLAADLLGLRLTLTVIGGTAMIAIAWAAYSSTLAAGVALALVGLLLQVTQDNLAIVLTVDLRLGWVSALELLRQLLTTVVTVVLVVLGARLVPFLGMSVPVGLAALAATVVLVRGTRTLLPAFSLARWRLFVGPMIPFSLRDRRVGAVLPGLDPARLGDRDARPARQLQRVLPDDRGAHAGAGPARRVGLPDLRPRGERRSGATRVRARAGARSRVDRRCMGRGVDRGRSAAGGEGDRRLEIPRRRSGAGDPGRRARCDVREHGVGHGAREHWRVPAHPRRERRRCSPSTRRSWRR